MNWTKIFGQVNKIEIKSITDSLFRYAIYIMILGLISSSATVKIPSWVTIFLFLACGIFLIVGIFFYFYFAIKNPDYLRSESFQIKKQSIDILGDSDHLFDPNIKGIIQIASPQKELNEKNKKNEFGQ